MKNYFLLLAGFIVSQTAFAQSGALSMIEINPAHGHETYMWMDSSKHVYGAGELSHFAQLNGKLYFAASDTMNNEQLWVTDGTAGNTHLVKEINPYGSANISSIIALQNKIVFVAMDSAVYCYYLFSSDGTAGGTQKLIPFQNYYEGFNAPRNCIISGGKLYFFNGYSFSVTDGTPGGTNVLHTFNSETYGNYFTELNNKIYFSVYENGQTSFWSYDIAAGTTQQVIDLTASTYHITGIYQCTVFDNKIFFTGAASSLIDLYSFDGNVNGTVTKIPMPSGQAYNNAPLISVNNNLFVAGIDNSASLYRLQAGSSSLSAIPSLSGINFSTFLISSGGNIYFQNSNYSEVQVLHCSDLSHAAFSLGSYLLSYCCYGNALMVGIANKIFFQAYDSSYQQQFFMESDGTTSGTFAVPAPGANTLHPFNFEMGCGIADVFDFTTFNYQVIVPANFNDAGRELWIYKPLNLDFTSGVSAVNDEFNFILYPNPADNNVLINLPDASSHSYQFTMMDASGKEMVSGNLWNTQTKIDLSKITSGNYFIRVTDSENHVATKQFVLQR